MTSKIVQICIRRCSDFQQYLMLFVNVSFVVRLRCGSGSSVKADAIDRINSPALFLLFSDLGELSDRELASNVMPGSCAFLDIVISMSQLPLPRQT